MRMKTRRRHTMPNLSLGFKILIKWLHHLHLRLVFVLILYSLWYFEHYVESQKSLKSNCLFQQIWIMICRRKDNFSFVFQIWKLFKANSVYSKNPYIRTPILRTLITEILSHVLFKYQMFLQIRTLPSLKFNVVIYRFLLYPMTLLSNVCTSILMFVDTLVNRLSYSFVGPGLRVAPFVSIWIFERVHAKRPGETGQHC